MKEYIIEEWLSYLMVIIGGIITSYGLEAVLIPNHVMDGGITGVSIMLSHVTSLGLGLFLIILNVPFLLLGYKQEGKSFALKSTIGIVTLSLMTGYVNMDRILPDDTLLVTVLGGAIIGFGIGIVLRNGGALDGTDVLAVLISKKVPFSVSEIIFVFNLIIFTVSILVFGLPNAICSVIAYLVAVRVMDMVQEGLDTAKSVTIITSQPTEIGEAIQARLGRGVTYIKGEGGHSRKDINMIYCVISRMEEFKLKRIIRFYDKKAFVSTSDVSEVKGGDYMKKDIH